MDTLITEVFADECSHLEIDVRFLRKLHAMQVGFVNKNNDHIEFFGGHLLGVHKVRFLDADENYWFEDILEANESALKERLHKCPDINKEWVVSSDVFNLSCVWLTHAIYNTKGLSEEQRAAGMIDVMLLMNYRFITSRLAYYFPYAADVATAERTYSMLSGKFSIREQQTWYNVLYKRSVDTISKTSIHFETITSLRTNYKAVEMINDCQGRIRDMIKNIYEYFIRAKREGSKITSSSDVSSFDGSEILKDKVNGLNNYTQYLKSVISDRNSFIKEELVAVIEKIVSTMNSRLFLETLEWISDNYGHGKNAIVEEMVDEVLTHSYGYLEHNRDLVRGSPDLIKLLARLKGVYMSSRSTDPVLMKIREQCEEIAYLATRNKNKNVLPSIRTGVMLYLVSRTFTKNHYS